MPLLSLLITCLIILFLFFFSSRRRHTRLVSDWSSDVCSSDLVVDDELLLDNSVDPLRLKNLLRLETVIENSRSAANYHFRRRISSPYAPGKTKSWGPICAVVDVILRLKAQPSTQSDVWLDAPIILHIEPRIVSRQTRVWYTGRYR